MNDKPGYQTTEFWAMVGVAVVGLINKKFGLNIAPETFLSVAATVIGYAVSRGMAKRNIALKKVTLLALFAGLTFALSACGTGLHGKITAGTDVSATDPKDVVVHVGGEIDFAKKQAALVKQDTWTFYETDAKWHWILVAPNHKILSSSQHDFLTLRWCKANASRSGWTADKPTVVMRTTPK